MGRTEFAAIENGSIGEAPEDMFFRLGMMYSTGAEVPTDYVMAHKWFNLAAMRGNAEAIRLRREIAVEMTEAQIAQAQRAARDWLKQTDAAPTAVAAKPDLRVAACEGLARVREHRLRIVLHSDLCPLKPG